MSVDKVQLQQQEVVNNEVVLTDINPITSTDSVFDTATGSTMQETLDRIWNAINSRLARYVNSVNNKTGVVVLDPSDVGLSKVDNVSFNEIKQWVIDYFKSMIKNHQLRLFTDFQDAQNLLLTQDQSLNSVPFYAEKYEGDNDYRAYIGYYYWDEADEELKINWKTINVVGKTDASIKYDKGEISVRIHPDEEALYVENGIDAAHSGLRIHPDRFATKLIECKCLYGDINATDRMLSAFDTTDGDPVRIFIDNVEVTTTHGHHLHTGWVDENNEPIVLRENQQILTSFDAFYTGGAVVGNPQLKGPNATFDLMNRQPSVGIVTKIPDPNIENDNYEIRFNTIRSFTSGLGTKYYPNHTSGAVDSQLGIDFATSESFGNESGLTAQIDPNGLITTNPANAVPHDTWNLPYRNVQPHGFYGNHGGDDEEPNHGVVISTDESICRYPVHMYIPAGDTDISGDMYLGSKRADNWSPTAVLGFEVGYEHGPNGDITPYDQNWGYPGPATYLSVNLNKLIRDTNFSLISGQPDDWNENFAHYWYKSAVSDTDADFIFKQVTGDSAPEWRENTYYEYNGDNDYKYHFTDISGLRLNHADVTKFNESANATYLDFNEADQIRIGIYDGKDSLGNPIKPQPHTNVSGGLSVNVGNFLEICPKSDTIGETYEESGKVQVRIGKGLCDDHVIDKDFIGFDDYPDGIIDGYINFTVFDTNTPPPDYYTNPDNYAFIDKNGIIIPITSIYVGSNVSGGSGIKFRLINFGDDYFSNVWNDHYTDFYKIYDIRQGYQHIPQQMSPPPMIDNGYFYYGPTLWMNVQVAVQVTRFYAGVVRVKRTNRIAVSPDYESITFDSYDRLKVNSDESLRVTGSIDQRKLKAFPIARKMENRHYYPGEIFSNAGRDILFVVKGEEGVDVNNNIDALIADGKISVFRQTSGGDSGSVIGIRRFAFNTTYAEDEIIECTESNLTYLARVIKPGGLVTNGSAPPLTYVINHELKPLTPMRDSSSLDISSNGSNMFSVKIDGDTIDDGNAGLHVKIDERTVTKGSTGLTIPIDGSTIYYDTASHTIKAANSGGGGGGGASSINVDNKSLAIGSNNTLYAKLGNTLWLGENGDGPIDVDYDSDTLCVCDNELSVNYDTDTLCVTGNHQLSVYRSNIIDGTTIKLDDDTDTKLTVNYDPTAMCIRDDKLSVYCDQYTTYVSQNTGIVARPIVEDILDTECLLRKGQIVGLSGTGGKFAKICVATNSFTHHPENLNSEISSGDLAVIWSYQQ